MQNKITQKSPHLGGELKTLRSLNIKKFRTQKGMFILEGYRIIKDSLQSNYDIEKVWMTDIFEQSAAGKFIQMLCEKNNVPTDIIPTKTINQLSDTRNNQGIIASARMRRPKGELSNQVLVLYKISDPGNLGTLLRTAAWFGIKTVVLSDLSTDAYSPKVVRAAMGAHFYLDILDNPSKDVFQMLRDSGHTIIGGVLDGEPLQQLQKQKLEKWALVLGSEAHGFDEDVLDQFKVKVTITKLGNVDSLNVSIAGGIILYALTQDN